MYIVSWHFIVANASIPHFIVWHVLGIRWRPLFNPLRATFFRENINIYLHFVSFLHIDPTQVVEIRPQIKQEPTYSS